ncbi:hypothetical protein J2Z50_006644 [Ensifer mexicanus]|nr:hypothetical protein [Sinorhizobium mexicanum]
MASDSGSPTLRKGAAVKMVRSRILAGTAVVAFVTWVGVAQPERSSS